MGAIAKRVPSWADTVREEIAKLHVQIRSFEMSRSTYEAATEAIERVIPNHDAEIKIIENNFGVSVRVQLLPGDDLVHMVADIARVLDRKVSGDENIRIKFRETSLYWPDFTATFRVNDNKMISFTFWVPNGGRMGENELPGVKLTAGTRVEESTEYKLTMKDGSSIADAVIRLF